MNWTDTHTYFNEQRFHGSSSSAYIGGMQQCTGRRRWKRGLLPPPRRHRRSGRCGKISSSVGDAFENNQVGDDNGAITWLDGYNEKWVELGLGRKMRRRHGGGSMCLARGNCWGGGRPRRYTRSVSSWPKCTLHARPRVRETSLFTHIYLLLLRFNSILNLQILKPSSPFTHICIW